MPGSPASLTRATVSPRSSRSRIGATIARLVVLVHGDQALGGDARPAAGACRVRRVSSHATASAVAERGDGAWREVGQVAQRRGHEHQPTPGGAARSPPLSGFASLISIEHVADRQPPAVEGARLGLDHAAGPQPGHARSATAPSCTRVDVPRARRRCAGSRPRRWRSACRSCGSSAARIEQQGAVDAVAPEQAPPAGPGRRGDFKRRQHLARPAAARPSLRR